MRNTILASGSFVSGALFMFFMLSGIQTSTTAQPRPIFIEGAVPVVPPLRNNTVTMQWRGGGRQRLDGLECKNCDMDGMTLEYSGGAFKLENCKFSNTVDLELGGAALNTFVVLQRLSGLGLAPPPPAPKKPPLHLAFAKPTNITLVAISDAVK